MDYGSYGSSLRDLPRLRSSRRRRASAWTAAAKRRPDHGRTRCDRAPRRHRRRRLDQPHLVHGGPSAAHDGPDDVEADYLRRLVLRITWDDQSHPSVLVHARWASSASATDARSTSTRPRCR